MTDTDCQECGGTGGVDSGGFTPWGAPIDIPCPSCEENRRRELCTIGAAWKKDSSLEKWFPITAEELAKLKELNDDKFKTINAYCRAASLDKWKIGRLIEAIDQYISAAGCNQHTPLLIAARADVVSATQKFLDNPKEQTEGTNGLNKPTNNGNAHELQHSDGTDAANASDI